MYDICNVIIVLHDYNIQYIICCPCRAWPIRSGTSPRTSWTRPTTRRSTSRSRPSGTPQDGIGIPPTPTPTVKTNRYVSQNCILKLTRRSTSRSRPSGTRALRMRDPDPETISFRKCSTYVKRVVPSSLISGSGSHLWV